MNLFTIAESNRVAVESKKRAGKSRLSDTCAVPYTGDLMRRATKRHALQPFLTQECKDKTKGQYLAGTFILSYFTALAQCIVNAENERRAKLKKPQPPVSNSAYLVEALIQEEGFAESDYSQGKVAGSKRVEKHLKHVFKTKQIEVEFDEQLNFTLPSAIMTAILNEF